MNETVTMIFGLIGGLALFLFGMNNMSSSLQKVAGDRMKKVLGFLTRNPLLGQWRAPWSPRCSRAAPPPP